MACYLDPTTRTVVGVRVNGGAPLCASSPPSQGLVFNAPVTAVTVGLQPGGAGVASLRFSSAGGDLFCGYAVAPLLAKTVTASLKDRFLAGIDATGCYERANGAGPALATGALSFAFTSSPGAAYPTGAGATVVYNPETGTFNPVQTLQSDGSAGPGGVVAGGDPGASDPPGDPFGNPFGNPDPTLPDPDAIYDPVAPSEAFSWSETVVAGDEALAAAVAATDVAGFASPDNMPPDLGDAYASDNILSDIPPVPIAPATAEGLSLAQIAGAAAMADPAAADGAPTPQQVAGGDAESGSLFDPPAAGAGPASAGDEAGEGATAAATPPVGYANGVAGVPFTDSRVPGYLDGTRKTGQLYVCRALGANGRCSSWSFCTASLIGNSLLLTAAHCLFAYGGGSAGWPKYVGGQLQVYFYPQVNNNVARYGYWLAQDVTVPGPYYGGTDTCLGAARGVVCNNDVALVWLKAGGNTNPPQQAGARLGYNAYGFNNYGIVSPASRGGVTAQTFAQTFGSVPTAMVTQLGYPVAFDSGSSMQIGASETARYYLPAASSTTRQPVLNLMRGSAMGGGSSGGPWIVNYGVNAAGGDYGQNAARDVIIGVTSWGFTDATMKVSAASVFGQNAEFPAAAYGARGAGNIAFLVNWACDRADAPWKLQSKGMCTAGAGVGK